MKKIEKDLILLYALLGVMESEGISIKEYITDFDETILDKWLEKHLPRDKVDNTKKLVGELTNKIYQDIKNKK